MLRARAVTLATSIVVSLGLLGAAWSTGAGAFEEPAGDPAAAADTGAAALNLERIAGVDAVATAIAVSQRQFTSGTAGAVVLARSDHFADALAGGPLAAARNAPLLITPGAGASATIDARVLNEITRALPPARTVYVLGGTLALAPGIDDALRARGYAVVRLSGATQYSTAVAIALDLGSPGTVFEATGLHFADALSAVPAAISAGGAILLTDGDRQAPETADYLAQHPPSTRYAIGGHLAAAGADPGAIGVFGDDLYGTSAAVADRFFNPTTTFGVATGLDFPDALAGGVLMGRRGGPVLLVARTPPIPERVGLYFSHRGASVPGVVLGGPLAVPDAVVAALPSPLPDPPGGAAAGSHLVTLPTGETKPIDFPDPFIAFVAAPPTNTGGVGQPAYYAYSTNAGGMITPVLRSTDLQHWQLVGDAFGGAERSAWATLAGGFTWAPAMLERPANAPSERFVLYYTARSHAPGSAGLQCIGRALSATPEGPFTDSSDRPLICATDRGGSIDPDPIVVNGEVFLLFQSFGIAATGEPTRIWSIRLTPDGLANAWFPTELLTTWGWEHPVTEGPTMMPAPGGGFLLFYSARQWWTADYATTVAWCPTPEARCERVYRNPLLASRGAMAGPGGSTAFQDASGAWRLAFHAWTTSFVGYPQFPDDRYARSLRILAVTFPTGGRAPAIS